MSPLTYWNSFIRKPNKCTFCSGRKTESLQWGLWVFFSKASIRDAPKKIRKIVTYICGVGAILIGRSSLGRTLPQFFHGPKNGNCIIALMGTFCFVFPILRNPLMEIREIVEDICHMGGSQ